MPHKLIDAASGNILFSDLVIADNYFLRLRGFMLRKTIAANEALLLHSVWSIHTFFMLLPIDVIFIDKKMQVVKLVEGLGACRLCFCSKASSTIECRKNSIKDKGIYPGQKLHVL